MSALIGSNNIVTNGLIMYLDAANSRSYPGSGTVLTDLSQYRNNGTLTNGPTFNSANGGNIVFDGTNDYIQNPNINFGTTFTFTMWVKPTYNTNTLQMLVSNSSVGATANGFRFSINTFNTNDRKIYLEMGNGSVAQGLATAAGVITYNIWQQVVIVVDKTINTIKIYLNGVKLVDDNTMTLNFSTSNTFRLGIAGQTSNYPYKGNISVFMSYLKSLTDAEILQNYNATKARFGL
jgi:hypothetical protein